MLLFCKYNSFAAAFEDINTELINIFGGNAAWGDYDNDGDLDLVVAGNISFSAVSTKVYRNNGNGSFTYQITSLPHLRYSCAVWGDYNNDGYLDLALAGYGGSIKSRIFKNNKDGSFSDIGAGIVNVQWCSLAWAGHN